MESNTYSKGIIVIIVISLVMGFLVPSKLNNVGPMWFIAPWLFVAWTEIAYFWAMVHNKSYAVTWPGGHSSSAHGGVEKIFPARENFPEIGAVPLGGGNYGGLLIRGGKKNGWLMAPRNLLNVMDKQINSRAGPTEQIEPDSLPTHIRMEMEQHPLYDPRGPIVWALTPMDDPVFKNKGGMSATELVQQIAIDNKTINVLTQNLKVQLNLNAMMRKQMKEFGVRFEESEREKWTDKIKDATGVE